MASAFSKDEFHRGKAMHARLTRLSLASAVPSTTLDQGNRPCVIWATGIPSMGAIS